MDRLLTSLGTRPQDSGPEAATAARMAEGDRALTREDPDTALALYRQALESAPTPQWQVACQCRAAQVHVQYRHPDAAMAALDAASKAAHGFAPADRAAYLRHAGRIAHQAGQLSAAQAHFQDAATLDAAAGRTTQALESMVYLVRILREAGRLDRSVHAMSKARALSNAAPPEAVAPTMHAQIEESFLIFGRLDEAARIGANLWKMTCQPGDWLPGAAEALRTSLAVQRAKLAWYRRDPRRAWTLAAGAARAARLQERWPEFVTAREVMAWVHASNSEWVEARALADGNVALTAGQPAAIRFLGELLIKEAPREAIYYLDAAITAAGEDQAYERLLALMSVSMAGVSIGDLARAEAAARAGITLLKTATQDLEANKTEGLWLEGRVPLFRAAAGRLGMVVREGMEWACPM